MLPNQPDPFTPQKELKAHQLGRVTVVDVNARSLGGGGFTRDVRQGQARARRLAIPKQASTEGGYHLPAAN